MNIIVLDHFCIAQRIITASMHQCAIWLESPSVTLCRPNYIFEWLTDCKCRRNRIDIYAFRAESKSRNKIFPYIYETNLQSSGIWCHVDWEIVSDVSEEPTLSICMFCAFLDCMSRRLEVTWTVLWGDSISCWRLSYPAFEHWTSLPTCF
jgi:hypothetical protein